MPILSSWTPIVVAAAAVGGALAVNHYQKEMAALEKPKYVVLKALSAAKRGFFSSENVAEIRQYAPMLVAEVEFNAKEGSAEGVKDINSTSRSGFREVANFIFGNNTKPGAEGPEKVAMTAPVRLEMIPKNVGPDAEKVAMTAPVRLEMPDAHTSARDAGVYRLSFVMPAKYTIDTLPRPNNARVQIKEVAPKLMAVITFSGASPREDTVDAKRAELLQLLQGSGYRLKAKSGMELLQYHPPFMPGFLRRNEVALEVEAEGEGEGGPAPGEKAQ